MCLVGVVVRRYIDFLILLIPTPLVSALFCNSIPTFCSFKKMFFLYHRVCRISRARYTSITLFKHHHRVLRLISNRISV